MSTTRRSFITTAAGVSAACLVTDWALVDEALAHATQAVTQRPAPAFATLTPDEARELGAIAERIMPTTSTPGAREAGVIYFIDKALGTFEKQELPAMRKGLAELRTQVSKRHRGVTSFAALPAVQQDALLTDIEKTEFFLGMHFLTMVGMFANPSYGGNRGGIGWKLLGFDPRATYSPPFGYYDAEAAKGR